MSRKIFKSDQSIESRPFHFQQADMSGDPDIHEYSEIEDEPTHFSPLHDQGQADQDAQAIVSRARADAEKILEDARRQASKIEQEAYEKGYQEGQKSAQLQAEQQLQAMLTRYHQTVTGLDQLRTLLLDQYQLDFLDLVVDTAQKVLKAELSQKPRALLPMIKDALSALKQRKDVVLYLNPDDLNFINAMAQEERQNWMGTQIQLEGDAGLGQGSLRLETPGGDLDATMENKLELIRNHLSQTVDGS